ncbi:MAG TPA: DUF1573 domain-containing protein [Chitinophagaceae bacterium]|jgi:hypothetical protein
MKTLLTLLATAIMVNLAIAQGTVTPPPNGIVMPPHSATEILTLKETAWDFGQIQQGRPVTHDFMITNTGSDSLKLDDVRASCGCTTPEWKREAIPPNSTTRIKVGYNAYAEGPFEKTVTILYKGGQTKLIIIKGQVYKAPSTPAPENSAVQMLKQSN